MRSENLDAGSDSNSALLHCVRVVQLLSENKVAGSDSYSRAPQTDRGWHTRSDVLVGGFNSKKVKKQIGERALHDLSVVAVGSSDE